MTLSVLGLTRRFIQVGYITLHMDVINHEPILGISLNTTRKSLAFSDKFETYIPIAWLGYFLLLSFFFPRDHAHHFQQGLVILPHPTTSNFGAYSVVRSITTTSHYTTYFPQSLAPPTTLTQSSYTPFECRYWSPNLGIGIMFLE